MLAYCFSIHPGQTYPHSSGALRKRRFRGRAQLEGRTPSHDGNGERESWSQPYGLTRLPLVSVALLGRSYAVLKKSTNLRSGLRKTAGALSKGKKRLVSSRQAAQFVEHQQPLVGGLLKGLLQPILELATCEVLVVVSNMKKSTITI